jgi:iron complex outermembrane receptor protein
MSIKSRLLMTTCVLAALAASSGQASAQAAPQGGAAAADSGTGSTIGEVVVTANKREENLQDVSGSVSVVSQAAVERQGVKEFIDLTRVNPDIRVNTGIYTNITIRGVRTSNFGPTVDQPNAIHLDGVYISRSTALNGLFFDTERVEVLAGPQGTLYGRNSAGGTVNIISVKPRLGDFGGRASFEYGNYNTLTVNTAINVPIGEKFAMRAAIWRNRHDGYNDNGTDNADQEAGRLSLFWRPTDNDSFLFTLDKSFNRPNNTGAQKIRNVLKNPSIATSGCANGVYACLVAAGTPGSVVVPIPTGGPDGRDIRAHAGDQNLQSVKTDSGGVMGQYDHDFGWANLTMQAAYRDTFSNNTTGTSTGFNADPRLITTTVLVPAQWGGNILKSRWNTQEIRLTSPSNRPLTWVGGLYRFDEHTYDPKSGNYAYLRTFPNTSAATLGQVQYAMPLRIGNDASNTLNDTIAYAAFGQATYTFAEKLHFTGGLRYNDEKKHGIGFSLQNGVINPRTVFDDKRQWKAWTYKLNASYDITPQNMVYVDHSTGFKSGGFAFGSTPAYEPEKIKAYEVGTKNRFFDGKLTVNGSAWWYDYTNIVQTVFEFYFDNVLGRPNSLLNTTNGKKAKLSGQSVTADWQITDHDILSVNATHIKARFKEYSTLAVQQFGLSNGFFPGATATTFDYAGSPFPSVPKWAWNVSYDHIFDVAGGELDVQVAARYTGARLATNNSVSLNDPNAYNWLYTGGQTTFDASARYAPGNGRWSVTAYMRNIGNEDVIYNRAYTTNSTQYLNPSDPRVFYAYQTENYYAPRTFGVIVSANF